ncbi:DNA replication complex GINS protein psf1 [Wilcoxina mikolae CBS 423.85]|nr:DNA replication complex GINS protein psf1 [Wilcoxina mikolae CBS 423.85]
MYGDLGQKLVQHAKRTQSLSHLPPYQSELVRSVTREVRDLDRDVSEILAPFASTNFDPSANPATAYTLLVHHLCMRRNKRCLLAYHRVRVQAIEELCWSGGAPDEDAMPGVEVGGVHGDVGEANAFSPEEEEYMRGFNDLLAAAKGKWTDIDLTGSLEPPRDLFVDVRVLKDAGEIQTEYGAINLTKNSQFFVRQGDVERLIQQGFLQKLS